MRRHHATQSEQDGKYADEVNEPGAAHRVLEMGSFKLEELAKNNPKQLAKHLSLTISPCVVIGNWLEGQKVYLHTVEHMYESVQEPN